MKGVLKLEGVLEFNKVGKEGWGKIDYIGGNIFLPIEEAAKFTNQPLKAVELGVSLMPGAVGTGIRVEQVLNIVYAK